MLVRGSKNIPFSKIKTLLKYIWWVEVSYNTEVLGLNLVTKINPKNQTNKLFFWVMFYKITKSQHVIVDAHEIG
jgi:hypothetical protein